MNSYVLYIAPNCSSCTQAIKALENASAKFTLVNISVEGPRPPVSIMIVPALFKNDTLLAYGSDIPAVLNK